MNLPTNKELSIPASSHSRTVKFTLGQRKLVAALYANNPTKDIAELMGLGAEQVRQLAARMGVKKLVHPHEESTLEELENFRRAAYSQMKLSAAKYRYPIASVMTLDFGNRKIRKSIGLFTRQTILKMYRELQYDHPVAHIYVQIMSNANQTDKKKVI